MPENTETEVLIIDLSGAPVFAFLLVPVPQAASPSPCEHEREHNVDANADAEIQSFRLRLLIASGGSKKRRPPIPVFRVEAPTPAADRRSGGPMASSSRSSIPRINTALSSSSLPRASREGRAKLREAKETKDAPTVVIAGPPSKGTPLKSPHSAASARSGALSLPIPPRTRRSRAGTISSESGSTNSSDSGLDSDSGVGTEREDAQMQDRTERSIMTVGSSILEKGARLSFLESPNEPLPSSDSWPNGRRASTKKTAHPARADDHDDGDAASLRAGDSSELRSFPPAPTPPPCMPLPALPRICHSTFGDDEFDSRNEKRPEESKDKEDDHVRRAERIPMAAPENEREPIRASLYSVASTALGLDTELRIAELLELEIDSSCSILARGADVPAQPASKDDASELANIHNPARALKHSNKQFEQSVDGRHSRLSDADVATDVLSHLVERFQDGSHSPARVASNPNARPQIDPIEEGDLPDLEDEDGSGSDLDVMTYASTSVRSSSSEDVDDDDLQSLIDGILDSNEGSPAKARASPRSHSHSPPVAEAGEVVRRLSASSAGTDFTWPPPIQQIVQGTMGALPRASASRQSQRLRRSCSGEAFEAAGDTSLPSVQPSTYCGSESGSESQYDDDDDDDKSSYAGDSTLDHGGRDLTEDMTGASFGLEDSPCPPPRAYRQDGRGGASGPVREMLFRSNQLELGKLGPDKGGKEVLGSMQFNHAQNLHLTQSANTNELGESKTGALGAQSKTRAESALKLSKEKMDPVDRISPRERSSDLEPARAHGALSIDPFNLDLQVSLARVPESCETTFFTACQEQTPRGLFKTSGPPLPLSPPSSRKPTGKQTALFDRVEHSQDTRAPCKPPPQLLAPFEDTPLSSSERPSAFLIKLEGVQAKLNNKRLSSQEDTSEDSPSALALRRALQRKPSVSEEHDEPGTKPKAKFGRTSPTGSTSSCRASLSSARSTSPALIQTARIVPTARGRPSNIFNSEKAGVVTAPPVSVESAQQLDGSAVIEAEGEATLARESSCFVSILLSFAHTACETVGLTA